MFSQHSNVKLKKHRKELEKRKEEKHLLYQYLVVDLSCPAFMGKDSIGLNHLEASQVGKS